MEMLRKPDPWLWVLRARAYEALERVLGRCVVLMELVLCSQLVKQVGTLFVVRAVIQPSFEPRQDSVLIPVLTQASHFRVDAFEVRDVNH